MSDPSFWKAMMKRSGNFSPKLNSVSDVVWCKLCYYTLCEPNMIKSFSSNQELSFDHWKTSSTKWDRFQLSSRGVSWNRGGGDQWIIETKIDPEKSRDQEVFKANGNSKQNYVTSYGWCCREQVIKLADIGLTKEIMDVLRPAIEVSEWYSGVWDCVFCIRVELLDSKREVLKFYEHTEEIEQEMGRKLGWRKLQHVFVDYGPGVRFLRFADAGKDNLYWAGHYGSKMAAASARVKFN